MRDRRVEYDYKLYANPTYRHGEPVSIVELTYKSLHTKINRKRGRADNYECPCGNAAKHWSLMTVKNPSTLREGRVSKWTLSYSLDIWDYMALCVSCHKHLDMRGVILHDVGH